MGISSCRPHRLYVAKEKTMPDTTYEIFPSTGFTVTHFLVSSDLKKSLDFYSRILGGKVIMDGKNGTPNIVQLANTWVIINVGGGPTDDKPAVSLAPPKEGEAVSSFMNIRVANIAESYERWKGLGAEFLTEPKVHQSETRCYMRDPDGHLIEVGEAKK
jgi:catechol 2,3-dioxygenase-like lactoylglutathione lyase family enzyme